MPADENDEWPPAWRRCIAEGVGTFALVFAGTGAIVVNDSAGGVIGHAGIALTFGLIVMAMIYAIGDLSGAHINPAVTIAFWASGRFPFKNVIPYVIAQCGGALAASGLLLLMFPVHPNLGATIPAGPEPQSFLFEVVLTFLLMFVILNVSADGYEQGLMAGAAIGAVVALEAMFAGPICGASMNPARSLGPAVVSGQASELWIYLVAPTLGALLAIPVCLAIRPSRAAS